MKFLLSTSTTNGIIAFTRQSTCRRVLASTGGLPASAQQLQRRCMSGTYEAYAEATDRDAQRKQRHEYKKPRWSKRDSPKAAQHLKTATISPAETLEEEVFEEDTGTILREEEVEPDEQPDELPPPLSFPELGFDPTLVRALHDAFPNVKEPTRIQERLIPAILSGQDVLLRDGTGSGKTFGLVLAALNKPRMVIHDKGRKRRVVTTLFIVPHRDLALQIMHWIERITTASKPTPSLASIVQILIRGSSAAPLDAAVEQLRTTSPHILVSTPQAFLEVYEKDPQALQLSTLSTVIVDEVDYLVETAARKEFGKAYMAAYEKRLRKLKAHPGPTRRILDIIYAGRQELAHRCQEQEDRDDSESGGLAQWRNEKEAEEGHPQLVLSSATLRVHLKDYLFAESGWLNPYNLAKIMGSTATKKYRQNTKILHSVLVISDENEVRNVESAVAAPEEEIGAVTKAGAEVVEEDEAEIEDGGKRYYHEKYGQTPSPFDANALEAIAMGFALDVPSIALLVIPSSAPVQRAVYELRELGVNAEGLDVEIGKKGKDYLLQKDMEVVRANPRLLVATLATTRGLDLPELSHVFILGVPEGPKVNGRSVDAYVHLAGRVGRFGRPGRVVTVLGKGAGGEGWRMERILGSIGERAVRFEHFD